MFAAKIFLEKLYINMIEQVKELMLLTQGCVFEGIDEGMQVI